MNTSMVISLTGTFLKIIGETLADLKSHQIAEIDINLLDLKQSHLSEKLESFKVELNEAVEKEKAQIEQDLISRGLANSTVRSSSFRLVEQDASKELERATLEYNRAIEEIAIMKRRIKEQSRSWWGKLFGR